MTVKFEEHDKAKQTDWDLVLSPQDSLLSVDWSGLWRYRDLLLIFVRRDFVSIYKQTILGPLWFFIQPVFSTIIYTLIFGKIANISTDAVPQPIFYMSGIVLWNYFSECLLKTSNTFSANQDLFGKVFFPRLIVPLSMVVSNLLKLGVQMLLLVLLYIYYINSGDIEPNRYLMLLPILIMIMAFLGLSTGLIVTALTTKYRDLKFLVQFGVQLLMYGSPIVYPLSFLPDKYKFILMANPVTGVIESFRFALFDKGYFSWSLLGYSSVVSIVLLAISILIFNRVEKSFIDTV